MAFRLLTERSNEQHVSVPTITILPIILVTFHGLNCFGHVIYELQTSTHGQNIAKLMIYAVNYVTHDITGMTDEANKIIRMDIKRLLMKERSKKGEYWLDKKKHWGKSNKYSRPFSISLVDWGYAIRSLDLCRGVTHLTNGFPEYDTKLHLIVRLQPWSFGDCGVRLHCHDSQVHYNPQW